MTTLTQDQFDSILGIQQCAKRIAELARSRLEQGASDVVEDYAKQIVDVAESLMNNAQTSKESPRARANRRAPTAGRGDKKRTAKTTKQRDT